MAATLVKNADRMMSSASALGSGIELSFVDGCSGVIPFADLPEVAAGGGVMEIELPNPYEMVIVMNSGDRSEIPWGLRPRLLQPLLSSSHRGDRQGCQ